MPLLPAFAKLNLGLKVLFRRSDNFHEIATVFQTISLADSLEVTATRAAITSIDVESDTEIPGENLAVKAARLFLESTGLTAQVCIRISKRIPMGGGLGGGSTDAAALLLALPALLDHPLPSLRSTISPPSSVLTSLFSSSAAQHWRQVAAKSSKLCPINPIFMGSSSPRASTFPLPKLTANSLVPRKSN